MFKKIPGSTEYLINLEETIVNSYGEVIELKNDVENKLQIALFGKNRSIKRKFLKLLAWYEVNHIVNLEQHLDKLLFCPVIDKSLRVRCGNILTFTEPIQYNDKFRYIPSFPRYAINLDGEVLDTLTNVIVADRMTDKDGYVSVYIYNPDKNGNRWTRLHRLMALAWLPNNDFITRPFVNHLDGNRANYKLENLEWCSAEENAQHALLTGLTKTTIKMKSRDRYSGEVVIYHSAAEMKSKLGMSGVSASSWAIKLPGFLYKGRYEIKRFDDNSPWYYETNQTESTKAIFTITTLNKKTGEVRTFNNVGVFYKTYKLPYVSGGLDNAVAAFKEKYKDFEISYKRNSIRGPYRVLDIETGAIETCDSIMEAGGFIGRSRTELQYDLSRNLKFIYSKKWIVVPSNSSGNINIEDYKDKPKAFKSIEITKENSSEIIIAKSLKHAAKLTGVDHKSVAKHLDSGSFFKGLRFRALE